MEESLRTVQICVDKGYRMVGVLGLRGSGKTVFIVRMIEALMEKSGVKVPARSLFWLRRRRLRKRQRAAPSDSMDIYVVDYPDRGPNVVFVDIAGEHFAEQTDSLKRRQQEKILGYLRSCDAYMLVYPVFDDDNYDGAAAGGAAQSGSSLPEDDLIDADEEDQFHFHFLHIQQALATIMDRALDDEDIPDIPTPGSDIIDKPMMVLFSKADAYPEECRPGRKDSPLSPLTFARERFPGYRQVINNFKYVRFGFISTGSWLCHGPKDNRLSWTSRSRGLVSAAEYVVGSPSPLVWPTAKLLKRSPWLALFELMLLKPSRWRALVKAMRLRGTTR